jgi:DNA (cytosine-5)-methyltransferase 1
MKSNLKIRLENTDKFELLSLFSGAGGLDHGFESTGHFVTKVCVESESIFCRTLKANQKGGYCKSAAILNQDLQALRPSEIAPQNWATGSPAGIIGGPPCESYSSHGLKKGISDPRGRLVFVFVEWVIQLLPKFFLMENVPLLANADEGRVLAEIINKARKFGYTVDTKILNAADFGAATKRKRLLIIGLRGDVAPKWPKPTHGNDEMLSPYVTVRDAINSLPPASPIEPGDPQGHVLVRHTEAVANRFASLRQGQYDKIRKRSKLSYDLPSPTLVAGNLSGIRSHIHPEFPRELTNRESARIHGFPDNFIFSGNHAAIGKQVANSVPFCLARALAKSIAGQLIQANK